jgi:hypothetical protein
MNLPPLPEYEREAAPYALSLLHSGIKVVDSWYSGYTACDRTYLIHYYRTGEMSAPLSFWKDGTPLLQEKPILDFVFVKRIPARRHRHLIRLQ